MTQPFPTIYHDGKSLYLEFEKYALRFAFTEGGLGKALTHIPRIAGKPAATPTRPGNIASGTVKASGKIARISKATKRKREVLTFTPEQRAAANTVLRNLKAKQ